MIPKPFDFESEIKPIENQMAPPQIPGVQIFKAPQAPLTAADLTGFSTSVAGAAVSSSSIATLDNMRTRIDQIEQKLKNLGLLSNQ